MNFLGDEIQELLSKHDFGYEISVVRSFNASAKVFPRIVVRQINDMTAQRDATKELTSLLTFQFDIYAKDTIDNNGNIINRIKLGEDIAKQIDEVIYKQYKMNRDSITDDDSYATDITRRIMRYSCAVDQFGYTYRLI